MSSVIDNCRDDYNWVDDDTKDYSPGWQPRNQTNMTEQCIEAQDKYDVWKYRNSLELKCAPYVGAVNTYKVLTDRQRIIMPIIFSAQCACVCLCYEMPSATAWYCEYRECLHTVELSDLLDRCAPKRMRIFRRYRPGIFSIKICGSTKPRE